MGKPELQEGEATKQGEMGNMNHIVMYEETNEYSTNGLQYESNKTITLDPPISTDADVVHDMVADMWAQIAANSLEREIPEQ